jgi:hypothetical protein
MGEELNWNFSALRFRCDLVYLYYILLTNRFSTKEAATKIAAKTMKNSKLKMMLSCLKGFEELFLLSLILFNISYQLF